MRAIVLLGAVALVSSSGADADDHPPDGLVVFVNSSSSGVSINVDGSSVCSISPGDRCSTILAGDFSSDAHSVSASSNGRTWSDKIKVSDCHANWFGTKTYTFRDDSVPFECVK